MYSVISNFNNLLLAYQEARKCKRYKSTSLRFAFFLESNLLRLQKALITETYLPSSYVCFTVSEPKTRKVAAPAFCDRVLQHSLVSQIEPLFDKQFIYDSYACRKGKGTHFGLLRIKKFLASARSVYGKDTPIYYLSMDIQKFFASVSWDILLTIVNRTVTCPKTTRLINKIVTTHRCVDAKGTYVAAPLDVVNPDTRQGIPIGNLTSQLFANVYLNMLDHFVKETLHVRWYARYMDDFLVIHPSLSYLKKVRDDITLFVEYNLHLHPHPKKNIIQNTKNGVPFVGYLIFYDHVKVRGSTLLRMRRKLKKRRLISQKDKKINTLNATISSLRGHLDYANSFHLQKKMFEETKETVKKTEKSEKIKPEQLKLF